MATLRSKIKHPQSNKIGTQGAEKIGEALAINNTLTTLNLMVIFVLATTRLTEIELLQINQIGEEGAEMIGKALKSNNTLTTLHLGVRLFRQRETQFLTFI